MKPIKTPVLLLPLALGMAGALMVRCTPDLVVNPAAPVTTGGTSVTNPSPATGTTVTRTNMIWVTNDKYQYLAGYGTASGPPPNFANPVSVQVVGSGSSKHIYVSDSLNGAIHYLTYNGSTSINWVGWANTTNQGHMMNLDSSSKLWVSVVNGNFVTLQVLTNIGAGLPMLSFTNSMSNGSGSGQASQSTPLGCAFFSGTGLFFVDRGNNRVEFFSNTPSTNAALMGFFSKQSQMFAFNNLSTPTAIRADFFTPGAFLIVDSAGGTANNTQNRILSVDANFNLLRIMGNPTTTPGILLNPVDVATNSQRHYLVVDRGNHRVVRLNSDGYLLEVIGGNFSSSDNGKFFNPYGIATDRDDLMYVVDQGNNRFQIFTNTRATNLVTNITRVWSNF